MTQELARAARLPNRPPHHRAPPRSKEGAEGSQPSRVVGRRAPTTRSPFAGNVVEEGIVPVALVERPKCERRQSRIQRPPPPSNRTHHRAPFSVTADHHRADDVPTVTSQFLGASPGSRPTSPPRPPPPSTGRSRNPETMHRRTAPHGVRHRPARRRQGLELPTAPPGAPLDPSRHWMRRSTRRIRLPRHRHPGTCLARAPPLGVTPAEWLGLSLSGSIRSRLAVSSQRPRSPRNRDDHRRGCDDQAGEARIVV